MSLREGREPPARDRGFALRAEGELLRAIDEYARKIEVRTGVRVTRTAAAEALAPHPQGEGSASVTFHLQQQPERYEHGTLARYNCGCHCRPCKDAKRAAWKARNAKAIEAAREITTPATPCPQTWTKPDGTMATRVYTRACPGAAGKPCRFRRHLRKDSKGGVCGDCRLLLVWNGIVDASRARKHLLKLARHGVGRRAVEAACDVSDTLLHQVKTRQRTQIRADTERRILAVDAGAVADHACISAARAQKLIGKLLAQGYTRTRLAALLGYKSPALQLKGERITAKNALRVERLYRQLTAEAGQRRDEDRDLCEPVNDEGWKRRLVDAYLDGVPVNDLALRFGKEPSAISQLLSRAGVTKQKRAEDADAA